MRMITTTIIPMATATVMIAIIITTMITGVARR